MKRHLRALTFVSVAAATIRCSDSTAPQPLDNSIGVIVSGLVAPRAGAGVAQRSASLATGLVYVSLPPSSVPNGVRTTVTNRATGGVVTTAILNGGFDPVAIGANVGDTLAVDITTSSPGTAHHAQLVVAARRPPRIVRTNPPNGGRDVPLNSTIVVVFSEPIDSATIDPGVGLRVRDTVHVSGDVAFGDAQQVSVTFSPADRLAPLTTYQFVVTQAIRDLNGIALDSAVRISFTTAADTAPPPPPSLVGTMLATRARHTATALPDGSVLVIGGDSSPYSDASIPYSSAELYDPATGTFSLTGPMAHEREAHTATLLADGKVLVVGGWNATEFPNSSAELYDPTMRAFEPTGGMDTGRVYHTATLLQNGKVLIVGGFWPQSGVPEDIATAELYDPALGLFSRTGNPLAGRYGHTATLLPNGKVLIAGGRTDTAFYASAELYDPGTGTFTPTGSMAVARIGHTATLLANGKVLIAGGTTSQATFASAEIYDPSTGRFSPTGSMSGPRSGHSATPLLSGQVLIAGGGSGAAFPSVWMTAELFDPIGGVFVPAGQMANPHAEHRATLLSDGSVLITGGIGNQWGTDGWPAATAAVELYRGSWATERRP